MYIGLILLLNIPLVQQQMSVLASRELSALLGSELKVGHIETGLLNRIVVNDLMLNDQSGQEMLKVARLSARFDILPLLKGKVSISNVQLFGFDIQLRQATPQATPNFRFVIDAFARRDSLRRDLRLDLRINSLLIRRGRVSYDVLSEAPTPGRFNPRHICLKDIIATISLKALRTDSLNAAVKRMSITEENSGFSLKKLSLKMVGNEQGMEITNFAIDLPHTSLQADTMRVAYDSLGSFRNFAREVSFSFHLKPSPLALSDLSAFLPAFKTFNDPLWVEAKVHGCLDDLRCPLFSVTSGNRLLLRANMSVTDLSTPHSAYLFGELSNCYLSSVGQTFLARNLGLKQGLPPALQHLGTVSFHGEVSGYFNDLVTYGQLQTALGTVDTDLMLTTDRGKGLFAYSGSVKAEGFDVGQMLPKSKLGNVSLNVKVEGQHVKGRRPSIVMNGSIDSLAYSGYTYERITLNGQYGHNGFQGEVLLDDKNAHLALHGNINTASEMPTFDFQADIRHFRPNALHLTPQYEGAEISLGITSNFVGGSIDEMNGEISIDSLTYDANGNHYVMDKLLVTANTRDDQNKHLSITSPFVQASIVGNYSYRTLPASILNILHKYLPDLIPATERSTEEQELNNNFTFDIHILDTDLPANIFQIPLKVYTHSAIKGYVNDKRQKLHVEGYFPQLRYGKQFIESGVLLCDTYDDRIHTRLRFNNRMASNTMNIAIEAQVHNNRVEAMLNWGNSGQRTYSGKLSAAAHFLRPLLPDSLQTDEDEASRQPNTPQHRTKTVVDIYPTDVILNDTLWNVHPARIVVDSGRVHIHNFNFSHKDRHLNINGTLSKSAQDTVRVTMQDINIGYVFDMAQVNVNFQGEATGEAYACGLLDKPAMAADVRIRNLGLNDGLLGDGVIHGEWHHDKKGIFLEADITEKDIAHSHVKGYVFPIKPNGGIDLQIEADNTNLDFIHFYMQNITSEFHGRATGKIHFYGRFRQLAMEGAVVGNASMKVDVLNTTYTLSDSIYIEPEGLTFKGNRITDAQGHRGFLRGRLRYKHFRDIAYQFAFDVDNMLVMNTKESPDYPFYGTVYGTGNASIEGSMNDGVSINVAMQTDPNSVFTYIKNSVSSAATTQFIQFVDKTPRRATQDISLESDFERDTQDLAQNEETTTDIRLNLLIDATPDATMRIIMDPLAGDNISGRGTGNIRIEFYNKGDVKMFGNYRIAQGLYKFSLQEIIRKDFAIQEGSTIAFNGNPLNAELNINAIYTVNSASLNDLVPNASEYVNQTNVKVNCTMNISGQLTSPTIQLGLELPNERDEVQALVRNYIPTEEQMNMEILYLLSIGKFYTPENVNGVQNNSDMMSSVLSSTLSGQLNNALSHIIDNNNWNIGTNFSTGEKGWTDMEFEGMLSGQLLNNRLLINGNFGYRDNPTANTNFVGDFEAEWLVTRSGNIRLKAYNETNDRYYTRTNLTTQGIGIIFQKDFEHWNELLFWNRWKLNRLRKRMKQNGNTTTDSLPANPTETETQTARAPQQP